ncbi:MAG: DNA-3-methyladenine glycosylase [Planctomycetota bacterium]
MPDQLPRLGRDFYQRDPVTVARALLGQKLVHQHRGTCVAGLIVETEAYLGKPDKAAHSHDGKRTPRTQTMFADGGTAYVFLNYGIHHLLNVVVAEREQPQAVLIRAIEPTEGLVTMRDRRPKAKNDTDLCSGPGKLGAAFGVDLSHDGIDLVNNPSLYIEQLRRRALPDRLIQTTTRVGVDYAKEWAQAPLRFYIKGNPHVSVR